MKTNEISSLGMQYWISKLNLDLLYSCSQRKQRFVNFLLITQEQQQFLSDGL